MGYQIHSGTVQGSPVTIVPSGRNFDSFVVTVDKSSATVGTIAVAVVVDGVINDVPLTDGSIDIAAAERQFTASGVDFDGVKLSPTGLDAAVGWRVKFISSTS